MLKHPTRSCGSPIAETCAPGFALLLPRGGDEVVPFRRFVDADAKNLTVKVILAAELAREPATLREADALFTELMAASNDSKIIEVVVRSHLEQSRPGQIIADLDRAFGVLKKDDKKDEKPITTESVAAKAFAAEKVRVIGDLLRADAEASKQVLRAGAADLQAGTKRDYHLYYFLGQLAARHGEPGLAALQFQEAVPRAPRTTRDVEGTQGDAYDALMYVLKRTGRPVQVSRVCRDGLQNAQYLAPVFCEYHLSGALAERGDSEGGVAAADKALETPGESNRLAVRLQKMYVLRLLGKFDEAIAFGKKVFDEFDAPADRLSVRYALAGAYWGAKKSAEAEAERGRSSTDQATPAPGVRVHLADQRRT